MTGKPRVVLVTGASAGIGLACADLLHAAGRAVIGASRRGTGGGAPAGPAVRAPAAAAGGWAGRVMDVDDDDSVRDGVRGIIAAHGRIDAIVAAAGWGVAGPVELTAVGEAKAQLERRSVAPPGSGPERIERRIDRPGERSDPRHDQPGRGRLRNLALCEGLGVKEAGQRRVA